MKLKKTGYKKWKSLNDVRKIDEECWQWYGLLMKVTEKFGSQICGY